MEIVTAIEIQQIGIPALIQRIHDRVKNANAFVTFDIDSVGADYAPGTGTPKVGGFTSLGTLQVVRGLEGLWLIGFDIVEILPAHDPTHVAAIIASTVIYEFICPKGGFLVLRRVLSHEPLLNDIGERLRINRL